MTIKTNLFSPGTEGSQVLFLVKGTYLDCKFAPMSPVRMCEGGSKSLVTLMFLSPSPTPHPFHFFRKAMGKNTLGERINKKKKNLPGRLQFFISTLLVFKKFLKKNIFIILTLVLSQNLTKSY